MPIELVLRAFAEVSRDSEANEVLNAVLRLCSMYEIVSSKVERYWKIVEWYELLVVMRGRDTDVLPMAAAEHLSAALGTVWSLKNVGDDDADATWRGEDGGQFVDARVAWADLQCFLVEKKI